MTTLTSTVIVATDVQIWIDDASGTPQDMSGSSTSVEITLENGVGEWRNFSSPWMRRKVVGKSGSFALNCVYTTAADEASYLMKNWELGGDDDARTITVYVPTKNVGSDVYQAEVVLGSVSFTLDAEADDVVRMSADLMSHGDVTLSNAAT